ncbi:Ff.00g130770.m01.CDS01 [Fusarium sp. VM40]|nr:Ff.00g130770.m01.CDS01 [Fusarium sp. VM40]
MASSDRQHLLRRLSPGDQFATQQRMLNDARIPGTCRWFLEDERIQNWLHGDGDPVLWLHGPSGSGKTFLSSSIVDNILTNNIEVQKVAVGAYYFGRRDVQCNAADYNLAFRSITRQIVAQLPSTSTALKSSPKEADPDEGDVYCSFKFINRVNYEYDRMVIVLDGVDPTNEDGIRALNRVLFSDHQNHPSVRLLMTARSLPTAASIRPLPSSVFEVRANRGDLALYYCRAIDESPVDPTYLEESHTKLFDYKKLFDMSDGLFLPILPHWFTNIGSQPNQVLLDLVELWSEESNRNVPHAFCKAIVDQIKLNENAEMILCVLYHLVQIDELGYSFSLPMAYEALDTWGIRHKNGEEYSNAKILESCAGLVFLDPKTHTLRLRSPLLMQYLRLNVFGDEDHTRHVAVLMQYLSQDSFSPGACNSSQDLKKRFQAHPYLWYAARNLSPSLAGNIGVPESFDEDFLKLTTTQGQIESYLQGAEAWPHLDEETYDECEEGEERWRCFTRGYTSLHLAAHLGVRETTIQMLIDSGVDLEACTTNGHTALHIAAEIEDDSNTLRRLLQCGSDVAIVDHESRTPLSHAIIYGKMTSVELLLEHGADIGAVDEEDLLECLREKPEIAQFLVGLGVEMPEDDE